MKTITLLLQTEQPVLATSLQGDPNSDVSYPYIPGSLLRGLAIERYLKQHSNFDITDENVRRLFFNCSTCYLNAYLYDYNAEKQQRCLPMPRCLVKNKGSEPTKNNAISAYDLSQIEEKIEEEDFTPKPLSQGFCRVEDDTVTLYELRRRINIHNLRDRQRGRATERFGEVFRYDAIDAGQIFQGAVLCQDREDAETLKKLLEESADLWIGGSRSAGYGHVKIISPIKILDSWDEVGISPNNRGDREVLSITLLSHTILRDKWGQYVPDPQLVAEAVGLTLRESYAGSTTSGGFNRKWGLPLPQVSALAAGSVFVFEEDNNFTADRIRNLEARGIGERRTEGFGRIAVNWLTSEKEGKFDVVIHSPKKEDSLSLTDPYSCELAKKMAETLLRQKLDVKLREQVKRMKLEPNKMSNSQLSRLALLARQALAAGDSSPILELLQEKNLPANARRQFQSTKVRGKPFDEKIRELLDSQNPGAWIVNLPSVEIAGEIQPLTPELKLEYTLRLIMAVVKQASKENRNDSETP